MHCSHCKSLMAEIAVLQDTYTEQTHYECPVCQRTQLVTKRIYLRKNDLTVATCRFSNRSLRHV
jgi:ribosomal protein L37AE/L43A